MLRRLALFFFLCGAASAQTTYLGLNLPSAGTANWNVPLNQNFITLDSYLGGATAFPNPLQASITGSAHNLNGGSQYAVVFQSNPNVTAFLTGNVSTTTGYLCETGTGSLPGSPSWCPAPGGSITQITAGTGLTGGGTSGNVTVSLATPVAAANGGLGAASLTGYLYGNGSGAATASTTIPYANLSGAPTVGTVQINSVSSPIVFDAGVLSCPTCTTSATGTGVTVNGGSTLGTLNLNGSSPTPDASNIAATFKISGSNAIVEVPYGASGDFGVLECGSGVTCTSGVISVTGAGVSSFSGDGTLITNSSSTGAVTATLATAGAHTVFGNRTGSTAAPSYGVLVSADIPNNAANTSGTAANITATTNSTLTTLSSLALPYGQLSGSVPTWNQNTTGTAANVSGSYTANFVYASPNGSSGALGARALVGADIPAVNLAGSGNGGVTGNLGVSHLNSGTGASSSTFWRGDGTWATPAGSGTIIAGGGYALPAYPSSSASTLSPSNITTDSTGNNLLVPGGGSFGASPPAACGTASGCLALNEGSTAGSPTASEFYMRPDSVTHLLFYSENGSTETAMLVLVASLTTTAASSDNVAITGVKSGSHCGLTPTNASAASDQGSGAVYVSAKTSNQITVTHSVTSGETFDVLCTSY